MKIDKIILIASDLLAGCHKRIRLRGWLKGGLGLATLLALFSGAAQDQEPNFSDRTAAGQGEAKTETSDSAKPSSATASDEQPGAPRLAQGTQDILKMASAQVSKEVIKLYVETHRFTEEPGAADLVALKEHGIPDDVTTALLKRSAGVTERKPSARGGAATPVYVVPTRSFDPESYEYFQYYYLYPRTLAYANERLGLYSSPYFHGYYGPSFMNGRSFGLAPGYSPMFH